MRGMSLFYLFLGVFCCSWSYSSAGEPPAHFIAPLVLAFGFFLMAAVMEVGSR